MTPIGAQAGSAIADLSQLAWAKQLVRPEWTGDTMTQMERRKWAHDVHVMADQLIKDYRDAKQEHSDDPLEAIGEGDLDAIGTMQAWQEVAEFHGEEFRGEHWLALVHELAKRAATADLEGASGTE
jgi:hypothetical protein